MSDLFFQSSDFISARTDLPTVQNVSNVFTSLKYEADAYGHWAFYGDNPLIDKVNGRNLVVQAGSTVAPIYSLDGVALANSNGNALLTDLTDSSSTNVTAIFVAKTTNNSLYLLGMTLPSTASTTENGAGIYLSGDKAYLNVKPLAANISGGISGLTTNQNVAQTGYCLVAASINKTTKTALLYTMKSGVDSFISTTFASAYADSVKKISIGNAYYTAVESGVKTTFAEAVVYNKALNLTEIRLAAQRIKKRLALNGITF